MYRYRYFQAIFDHNIYWRFNTVLKNIDTFISDMDIYWDTCPWFDEKDLNYGLENNEVVEIDYDPVVKNEH